MQPHPRRRPRGALERSRIFSLATLTLFALPGSLQAEIAPPPAMRQEETIPDYPENAIAAARQRATQARKQLHALQADAVEAEKQARPEQEEIRRRNETQLSELLSQINAAEMEARRLHATWSQQNKEKILKRLQEATETAKVTQQALDARLRTARSQAEQASQEAEKQQGIVREMTANRQARINEARADFDKAHRNADEQQRTSPSAWHDPMASLEDLVRDNHRDAELTVRIAEAAEKLDKAMIEGKAELDNARTLADQLDQDANAARERLRTVQAESDRENADRETRLSRIRQLADKVQAKPAPATPGKVNTSAAATTPPAAF
ncbi:MAG: hypothetical protein HQL96_11645 [Magnetococcales bacterium]|nr:hypothetical protein [Magnetococcales bacterium]